MGFILLAFASSIAVATFIENDFGTSTARALVYNSWWFELLIFIGIVNLSGIIITHKLYRKEKLTLFIFHLSFLVILIGAAITRFFGSEGVMHIREGESSQEILSENTYIFGNAIIGNDTVYAEKKILIALTSDNTHALAFDHPVEKISVACTGIVPNAMQVGKASPNGQPLLEMIVATMTGRETIPILSGENKKLGPYIVSLNDTTQAHSMNIWLTDSGFYMKAPVDVLSGNMNEQSADTLKAGKAHPFKLKNLYTLGSVQMVAKNYFPSGEIEVVTMPHAEKDQLPTAFMLKASVNSKTKNITYFATAHAFNQPVNVQIDRVNFQLSVGSKPVKIPFSLKLNKFIVEHYPGSNSPSWFESNITLVDPLANKTVESRIFMNNVLKYKGYRFYQSSYDQDEKGTILSVNRDAWGTLFTYLGYLLMGIGMILALFNKNSRFHALSKELKALSNQKKALPIAALIFMFTFHGGINLSAQPADNKVKITLEITGDSSIYKIPDSLNIDKDQVNKFGQLLIQDMGGRIKPIHSLSSELLRKISRKTKFLGLTSDELLLNMLTHPAFWQSVPMIRFSHPDIATLLQVKGKYVAFQGLFDPANPNKYMLSEPVSEAYRKKPGSRSKLDNELIRLDERANLCYLIYTGEFFRIYPKPGDEKQTWYNTESAVAAFHGDDSLFVANAFDLYLEMLRQKPTTDNLAKATEVIDALHNFQAKYGKDLIPSAFKIKLETLYNKVNIFDRLSSFFGLVGFVLLILQFIGIFKPAMKLKTATAVARLLIIAGFIFQFLGLAARWYISGHAPWSNGYESLIYIAFATILAGIIFSRKTGIALSVTSLLAWIILHVAHLSWMDPEITNLTPVLKSYWLVIHVAVITASYGFLALGALMAFLNLIFMAIQSGKNHRRIGITISELSAVIEMALIVGLYLLTIGTFLGGVWANESWGRYWGWDPKETWALVTVLVYAFIAHMRLIPGIRSNYLFNLFALLSFGCVIMTYFGVNYYLSGLHSYAKGDPLPVPSFVYYTIAVIGVIALAAYVNQKILKKVLSTKYSVLFLPPKKEPNQFICES